MGSDILVMLKDLAPDAVGFIKELLVQAVSIFYTMPVGETPGQVTAIGGLTIAGLILSFGMWAFGKLSRMFKLRG